MLKFRCQHCGQRIAVPARHLGKLATCPECGARTHPLAGQLAAASSPAEPAPGSGRAATAAASTTPAAGPVPCDNCGATIGRLQTVHAWRGHSVCGPCFGSLAGDSAAPLPVAAAPVPVAVARVSSAAAAPGPLAPAKPLSLEWRERVIRALVVFVVASVALYGALSLLRDIAGLVAVAAVAVLALLALYAVFRGTMAARRRRAPQQSGGPAARGERWVPELTSQHVP